MLDSKKKPNMAAQSEHLLQNWSNNGQIQSGVGVVDVSKRTPCEIENGQYFNLDCARAFTTSNASSIYGPSTHSQQHIIPCCHQTSLKSRLTSYSESGVHNPTLYFGGYTLCEVFCIVLIALSGLVILILLLSWGPFTPLRWSSQQASLSDTHKPLYTNPNSQHDQDPMNIKSFTGNPIPAKIISPKVAKIEPVYYKGNEVELTIKSSVDFSYFGNRTRTLKIVSLEDHEISPEQLTNNDIHLEKLEFLGPISLKWLQYIVEHWSKDVKYLHVDVDKTASLFSDQTKNFPTSSEETLEQLESVLLENSGHCKILDWPMEITAPNLKSVTVSGTNFDQDNLEKLTAFLQAAQKSLRELVITDSYLCPDCDLSDLHFESIESLKVLRQRDAPMTAKGNK